MRPIERISHHYADRIPKSQLLIHILVNYRARPFDPRAPRCQVRIQAHSQEAVTVRKGFRGLDGLIHPQSEGVWSLPAGLYRYRYQERGYVAVNRTFLVTEADVRSGSKLLSVPLLPHSGAGYDPLMLILLNEEAMDPAYGPDPGVPLPETPALDRPLDASPAFTTDLQLTRFLKKTCERSPWLHLYYLDPGHTIPLVFWTACPLEGDRTTARRLPLQPAGSAADTAPFPDLRLPAPLLKAARQTAADGRPTGWLQAGIHGNEPASTEAVLAMIALLTDRADPPAQDIVLLPRLNPDGARDYRRRSGTIDLNRDHLRCEHPITRLVHLLYDLLQPELMVDAHECLNRARMRDGKYTSCMTDLRLAPASGGNADPAILRLSDELARTVYRAGETAGFRVAGYPDSASPATTRGWASLQGSLFLSVESTGIGFGRLYLRRRMEAHVTAAKAVLHYFQENSAAIQQAVRQARLPLAPPPPGGSRPNFTLKTGKSDRRNFSYPTWTFDPATGEIQSTAADPSRGKGDFFPCYDRPVRQRPLPDAYLILKTDPGASRAVQILRTDGIQVLDRPAGTPAPPGLYFRYSGIARDMVLVPFPVPAAEWPLAKGWWLVPLDQPGWRVACARLEPDVNDCWPSRSTFVQSGLLRDSGVLRWQQTLAGK